VLQREGRAEQLRAGVVVLPDWYGDFGLLRREGVHSDELPVLEVDEDAFPSPWEAVVCHSNAELRAADELSIRNNISGIRKFGFKGRLTASTSQM
jgi:hypothetical protein